jgi:hypothetical protein
LSNPAPKSESAHLALSYYQLKSFLAERGEMVVDRRQHSRRTPTSPVLVSLDESRTGLLLDVSEGGVSLASILPRTIDEVLLFALDLPEGKGRLETKVEVAWTRDSGHLSGVRFVHLEEPFRRQLADWLSSDEPPVPTDGMTADGLQISPCSETTATTVSESTPPVLTNIEEASSESLQGPSPAPSGWTGSLFTKDSAANVEESPEGGGTSRLSIRVFLAVMLLSWALVIVGYRMGAKNEMPQIGDVAASTTPPEKALDSVSDTGSAEPAAGIPGPAAKPEAAQVPIGDPGFVLQVGAMKREANADSLAQSLQKKNLPAFVFRRGGPFYRVAVGPFANPASATQAKIKLEKNGLKTILRRWSPE